MSAVPSLAARQARFRARLAAVRAGRSNTESPIGPNATPKGAPVREPAAVPPPTRPAHPSSKQEK